MLPFLLVVFACEFLVMLVLHMFPPVSPTFTMVLDSFLLSLLVAPAVCFMTRGSDVRPSHAPMRLLTVSVLVSGMVLAWLGWGTYRTHRAARTTRERDFKLEELRGEIIHFDEVLTMSARMAAATGDLLWEKRYRRFEPQLGDAIREAIELAPSAHSGEAALQTDAANDRLVALENQAFDLVRQGRPDLARQILYSVAYGTDKELYAQGMAALAKELRGMAESSLQSNQRHARFDIAFVLVAFPVLLLGWLVALTTMGRHHSGLLDLSRQLAQLNESLDERVTKRTAQLHRSEQKFRSLIENLSVGIALIGPDMQVLELNPAMQRLFPERGTAQGSPCCDTHPTCMKDGIQGQCPVAETFADGQVHDAETQVTRDGEVRSFRVVTTPLTGPDGNTAFCVQMVEDVTERRRMEALALESEKLAAVRDLATGVAHNFNNLLTGALGYASFLAEDVPSDSDSHTDAVGLIDCLERATNLTRQLRLCATSTSATMATVTLGAFTEELASSCRPSLPPGVELVVDVTDPRARIVVPIGILLEALQCICDNAAEAMPDGGVVTVSGRACGEEAEPPRAVIVVADTGRGIPPDVLSRVFGPFFSTKGTVGVGLSLSVAKRIIDDAGGAIEVFSNEGQGTQVHVSVLLAPGDRASPVGRHPASGFLDRVTGPDRSEGHHV